MEDFNINKFGSDTLIPPGRDVPGSSSAYFALRDNQKTDSKVQKLSLQIAAIESGTHSDKPDRIQSLKNYFSHLNPFSNSDSAAEEIVECYPSYTSRIAKMIEGVKGQTASFNKTVSEEEITGHLLINKPLSIFSDVLSCFAVSPEGKMEKPRKLTENVTYIGAIVCTVVDFAIKHFVIGSLNTAAEIVGSIFTGVSSTLATVSCADAIYKCYDFEKKLDRIMQNEHLPEKERVKMMIHFLYEKTLPTDKEIENIRKDVLKKMPNGSEEERFKVVKQRILHLTKVKIEDLKKLAGDKGVKELIKSAETLLSKLDDPSKKEEAIADCNKLYETIKGENGKRKRYYFLMLGISVATFVLSAFYFGTFIAALSAGPAGWALLAVSIAINIFWVAAGLYYARDKLEHKIDCDDLLPQDVAKTA